MGDKKCLNCTQRKNCEDSLISWIFFIIGLVATVAIRIVTVLIDVQPIYGKIAWYIGIGGFLLFLSISLTSIGHWQRLLIRKNL